MHKTSQLLIEKCRILRKKGFTLGQIIKITKLPKTTTYGHIKDILLSTEIKQQIREKTVRRITQFNMKRKGKCIQGRIVIKPKGLTKKLIFLTAHFIFDGEITSHSCIYQNRNISLIDLMKQSMRDIFNLTYYYRYYKETGVHRISYHYIELADYFREKAEKLKDYIRNASLSEKRIFLQAFFDDEGCAYWQERVRRVRGFQHNLKTLKLIQRLLKDFDIESRIDEKYQEIIISRKENLIKFRNKINFSKGIRINPKRKNSIWKKELEKREILSKMINSYQK